MIFAIWCIDKPGMGKTRLDLLAEHRGYWSAKRHKMAFGGPLTSDDGISAIGSLIVAEFEDREAVEAWLSREPFVLAGLYETVSIQLFKNVWPQQVGFPAAGME